MKKIQRYSIPAEENETHSVQLPLGGQIVHVDSKSGLQYTGKDKDRPEIFIDFWVMLDSEATEYQTRHFIPIPAGEPIDDDLSFVSTVVVKSDDIFGGAIVFHVFEKFV